MIAAISAMTEEIYAKIPVERRDKIHEVMPRIQELGLQREFGLQKRDNE